MCPDAFSLSRVFLIHLPCPCIPTETHSLRSVCVTLVMKTDGLRETMVFPTL